ncbi:MAG: helix-turn-helix domain-containing protein [Pseudomonadota bacterium]|nr:DNA-binding protein [Pseudomonadota bacterium]QKK05622.1 MAG: helix-turn-helix domain-containing protein [Pseudomonadota bacterium]
MPEYQKQEEFMDIQQDKLSYSIPEVTQMVGLCRTVIYRELNSGRLRAIKLGKRTLITREAIEEWLSTLDSYPMRNEEGKNV